MVFSQTGVFCTIKRYLYTIEGFTLGSNRRSHGETSWYRSWVYTSKDLDRVLGWKTCVNFTFKFRYTFLLVLVRRKKKFYYSAKYKKGISYLSMYKIFTYWIVFNHELSLFFYDGPYGLSEMYFKKFIFLSLLKCHLEF